MFKKALINTMKVTAEFTIGLMIAYFIGIPISKNAIVALAIINGFVFIGNLYFLKIFNKV